MIENEVKHIQQLIGDNHGAVSRSSFVNADEHLPWVLKCFGQDNSWHHDRARFSLHPLMTMQPPLQDALQAVHNSEGSARGFIENFVMCYGDERYLDGNVT